MKETISFIEIKRHLVAYAYFVIERFRDFSLIDPEPHRRRIEKNRIFNFALAILSCFQKALRFPANLHLAYKRHAFSFLQQKRTHDSSSSPESPIGNRQICRLSFQSFSALSRSPRYGPTIWTESKVSQTGQVNITTSAGFPLLSKSRIISMLGFAMLFLQLGQRVIRLVFLEKNQVDLIPDFGRVINFFRHRHQGKKQGGFSSGHRGRGFECQTISNFPLAIFSRLLQSFRLARDAQLSDCRFLYKHSFLHYWNRLFKKIMEPLQVSSGRAKVSQAPAVNGRPAHMQRLLDLPFRPTGFKQLSNNSPGSPSLRLNPLCLLTHFRRALSRTSQMGQICLSYCYGRSSKSDISKLVSLRRASYITSWAIATPQTGPMEVLC